MTSMEMETLDIIAKEGGRLHYYLIAERLRISSHYAYVICKGLQRNGYIDFDALKGICSLSGKGKETVEKNWLFELKIHRERMQKEIEEDKRKISKHVKTINY